MRSLLLGLVLLCSVPRNIAAPQRQEQSDLKGSKDHPLISRYEGSVIVGYAESNFDEYQLLLGPVGANGQPTKAQTVTGKTTRILYAAPPERSTLEVYTNYEQALGKAGFNMLFSCSSQQCGRRSTLSELARLLYPSSRRLPGNDYAFNMPQEERYLAAMLSKPEAPVYVSLYIGRETNSALTRLYNRATVLLEIVEPKPMETGLVTVSAAAMAREIAASGHVALYGIYFDFNSAEVKPESGPTLEEIGKLLKQDAKLQLFVVGHTDNVGGYQFNMDLSRRRAAAVVKALVSGQHIDANRLQAEGVGFLAPVAPNTTDAGRAKNRRVELVTR